MEPARAAIISRLRGEIDSLGAGYTPRGRLVSGVSGLDGLVGGWPRPGLSVVEGAPGAGRLSLVLPTMARETEAGRVVAVVDVMERLHPPGLPGVEWSRLLVVRSGFQQAVWATEQLLCSPISLVVLLDPPTMGRGGHRLVRAAERGDTALVALLEEGAPMAPAALRLAVRRGAGGMDVEVKGGGSRRGHFRIEGAPPWG